MSSLTQPAALSNQALHLIVLPTEGCNFRCVYCYEDFGESRMAPGLIEGVKRLLTERFPELRTLSLSWFGGEPLLAYDHIISVLHHVASLRRAFPGTTFYSDITTNGYSLRPALATTLLRLGIRAYQISLDGDRAIHDRWRRRADGSGTFDVIWRNLEHLHARQESFQVTIRLHVTRENQDSLQALLIRSGVALEGDARFRFLIRPLAKLGSPRDESLPVLQGDEARVAVEGLQNLARFQGLLLHDNGGGSRPCYAARPNSFVIRADGSINKCTVALADDRNHVGHIQPNGSITLDGRKLTPWLRGLWTGDAEALRCPRLGLPSP